MTTRPLRRIAVVGGGIAGLTAAEELRRGGFDGELTIVGDETHAPYSRPALSKAALRATSDINSHRLPGAEHGAHTLSGVAVSTLDRDRGTLQLSTGSEVPFDGLVIASGSRARRLSDSPAEFTLRGLDDAIALRAALSGAPDVIVIGGGPLALEVASGCREAGSAVTLISRRTPMISHVGPVLAHALLDVAREAGVRVVRTSNVSVTTIDDGARVTLDDGNAVEASLVITAIGDEPNTEWLEGSDLMTDGQLRVDTRGRAAPGIVAAGDVAALPTANGWARTPLWTSAIEQAKVAAGALLLGDEAPQLNFQPYFWTEQFGVSLKVCGTLPAPGEPEVVDGSLEERRALLRWETSAGVTAASFGFRIPVPRLRSLTQPAAAAA